MKLANIKLNKSLLSLAAVLGYFVLAQFAFAQAATIGEMADTIVGNFESVGKLMIACAYIGGFAMTIAAVFKFKQHKDNPQQVPMGAPIALLVVGVLLVFLPSVFGRAGDTTFGGGQETGGFEGQGAEKIGA